MKILLLCKKFPWPLKDGEVLAIHQFIEGYSSEGHEVSVLAMNTPKHYTKLQDMPKALSDKINYHAVEVNTNISPVGAFQNLSSDQPYHVVRFQSKTFRAKLSSLLKEDSFDFIQCEGLYMGPYLDMIQKYFKGPLIMRGHNVESEIWQRVADENTNPIKKWYLKLQTQKLKAYESAQLNRYDIIFPISEKDAQQYKSMGAQQPMQVIPAGIEMAQFKDYHPVKSDTKKIGFIGSLDWLPNTEGLKWFVQKVWPKVIARIPEAQLQIAGRNTPASIFQWSNKNIEVLGEVTDQYQFMAQQNVLIVPLFSGSGMRIKIIEGMALGKAIVSTAIGAEGIDYEAGKNIYIANDPETFTQKITMLLSDKEQAEKAGIEAQELINKQYNNKQLIKKALAFIQKQMTV